MALPANSRKAAQRSAVQGGLCSAQAASATTPTEVETHVYQHSAAFKKAQLAAARANGKKLVQPTVSKAEKAKRQRKAGSAKGAATMQRRRAA